jgi:hypothetical protein
MSGPAEKERAERARALLSSPRRYSYDEILSELLRMHEDAEKYGYVLASWRERRMDILLRLIVLFETRKPQIVQAMREILRDLDGGPR